MNNENRKPKGGGRGPMGGPPGGVAEKPKNMKKSIKSLVGYLKPYHVKIIAVLIIAMLSTLFSIIGPKILARATNELSAGIIRLFTGAESGINFDYILKILLILAGLYVMSAVFSYLQGFIMSGISTKVSYDLRESIMKKINRLPLSYFNKTSHGDVLSRITNDVDTISQNMSNSITQMLTSLTSIIGVAIMMLTISVKMTLIAFCIIPVSLFFVMTIVKISQKHFVRQQKYLGSVNGNIEEIFGGHTVMKAYGGEDKALKQFDIDNNKLYEAGWKAQFISGIMMPAMNFVGNLGYVVICVVGAAMASGGSLLIGDIQAFIQYVRSFTQPISQMANISNQLQSMMAASERVFEFLDETEETNGEVLITTKQAQIKGSVSFDHVRFGYEDSEDVVIKDFSAEVAAGQKIAIVGPTGAGKTTMVKLLMRFHELKSGAIRIDNHDITDFERHDLRSVFAMVLQDTWLYNDTIMENIRYGRSDATDEEVIAAAKSAQAHHFIKTLPDGYNMIINEEASNISQGQKQLLTIARAILSGAEIMILDEATSSVDTRTELLIQKAMDNLTTGRTSFIIAHRLSTIRNADLILCLNEGDIVEQGNHEELLAKGGFYANLYNSQFEKIS